MVDVISLSGNTGIGENVVTSGLGPGPETPPTPPPRKRRGGASDGQRRWHEQWRERIAQQLANEALRANGSAMAESVSSQALDDLEWIDDAAAEADYLIMTAGDEALIRAPAGGEMHYARSKKYGLCAVLVSDTGARYLITGIGRTANRRVEAGDVIGKTPPVSRFVRAVKEPAGQLGPGPDPNVIDVDVFTIVVDADGKAHTYNESALSAGPSPSDQAAGDPRMLPVPVRTGGSVNTAVFVLGTFAAAIVMLTGQPLLAAFIFSGAVVLAAKTGSSPR